MEQLEVDFIFEMVVIIVIIIEHIDHIDIIKHIKGNILNNLEFKELFIKVLNFRLFSLKERVCCRNLAFIQVSMALIIIFS